MVSLLIDSERIFVVELEKGEPTSSRNLGIPKMQFQPISELLEAVAN